MSNTGHRNSAESSRRLYVTRLGDFTKKKDLLKAFRLYGCTHAVVQRRSTGNTAFLTFPTEEQAKRALEEAQKQPITIKKRQLRVLPADAWHDRVLIRPNSAPADGREHVPTIPPLPVEVLAKIAAYLPFAVRARMEMVSRCWRLGVWASMKEIRKLTSDDWRWPADWDMVRITSTGLHWATMRGGHNIEAIRLPRDARFTPVPTQNIAIAAKICTHLLFIDISGVKIRPTALREMAKLTSLEEIAIGQCEGPVDPDLTTVFATNRRLKTFRAEKTKMSGICFNSLSTELKHLELIETNTRPQHLAATIIQQTALEYLKLVLPRLFNISILESLSANTAINQTLQVLVLSFCNNNQQIAEDEENEEAPEDWDGAVADFFELEPLPIADHNLPAALSGVRMLHLTYCGWVDAAFIAGIGTHMLQIEDLAIDGCTNIRGQFALDPLASLERCKNLSMSNLYVDVGAHFLRDLRSLERLTCRDNQGVTSEDICGLIQRCTGIAHVDVEGCVSVGRPVVDCTYTVHRSERRGHDFDIFVGGTSAIQHRRDKRLLNARIHFGRLSVNPYRT